MNEDCANMVNYLRAGELLNIATYGDEALSSASVWYATSSDAGSLYFTSRSSRVHSENIRENGLISAGVVTVPLEGLGQKAQGVFLSGRATEAGGSVLTEAYEAYAARWPKVGEMFSEADIISGATPMRMYTFAVERFVWVDEIGHPDAPKLEFTSADLSA